MMLSDNQRPTISGLDDDYIAAWIFRGNPISRNAGVIISIWRSGSIAYSFSESEIAEAASFLYDEEMTQVLRAYADLILRENELSIEMSLLVKRSFLALLHYLTEKTLLQVQEES